MPGADESDLVMADPTSDENLALAAEFPAASRDDWRRLVDGVLKGRPFETLVSRSYDGLPIGPIYARATDATPIAGRPPGAPWGIMQRIDHPDPAAARAQAQQDLDNGATGLMLVCPGAVGAYGWGLRWTDGGLAQALEGIPVGAGIALELDLPPQGDDAARALAGLVKARGLDPSAAAIRFGLDPIGAMARNGWAEAAWPAAAQRFAETVASLARQGFKGPFAAADARSVHAAGGSEAQELAFALSVAVAYLRALEAGGVDLDAARGMIFFRLAADADQFLTIAKFRALRKLWARVETACGLAPRPVFIAAETAWRMMTQRDPYVNMLRTTMAAFSAAVGGADAITVLPFTMALGLPDSFARRLARNTQLVLAQESNLVKVADPAAGSGAVEDLTRRLCEIAWSLFQEIEREGGAVAVLAAGLVQEKVAAVRAARARAVAHRTEPLTGTTEFPDLQEAPAVVLDSAPAPAEAPPPSAIRVAPLAPMRLAEPFEALRDASDRMRAETGARPRIFLATLGAPADFTARATFARSLFEAGGIEAVAGEGTAGVEAMVAKFAASGARLACLCGSDEAYEREAAAAAQALARAGAEHVYLAGRPGAREAALKEAGVGSFVYAGCDALATLKAAHDILRGGARERRG